ncbi:MAG: peptidase dimerization domain-containing protein [Ignavibacteriales bacterium]|nr:peptidase dimerization domain-containing protein [Ignavibacteriales bacterium]
MEKIAKEKIPVKDFTVAFTTCEETTLFGSQRSWELMVRSKTDLYLILVISPGNFIYSACGAIGLKIKIIGKASHSGIAPEKGINSMQSCSQSN